MSSLFEKMFLGLGSLLYTIDYNRRGVIGCGLGDGQHYHSVYQLGVADQRRLVGRDRRRRYRHHFCRCSIRGAAPAKLTRPTTCLLNDASALQNAWGHFLFYSQPFTPN